jgi:hypothetical protein
MTTEAAHHSPSFRQRMNSIMTYLYDSRVEIVTTILLSFTALISAWSAYQSNAWGSQQSALIVQGNIASTRATRLFNQSLQQTNIDVTMFLQYSQAYSTSNTALAEFIYQRFRPEMKVAVDAWVETQPLENPDAPASPFEMETYSLATAAEAETYNQTASESFALALNANLRSTNYVLLMVVFATVLFFGGVAAKFQSRLARRILLSLALVMFVVGLIVLLTFPITA